MASTPSILVVGRDPSLKGEFEAALSGATRERVVVHHVDDLAGAVEAAGARDPDLVCADLGGDVRALVTLAEEIAAVAPSALVVAVYHRDALGAGAEAESVFLLEALRGRVRDFLRRPVASRDLSRLLERIEVERLPRGAGPRARVVAFVSNKGGVGKSTLATNTACSLAQRYPDEVLLIDAALQLGVCASLLDLEPESTLVDAARERDRLDETLLREMSTPHECGLRLLAAPLDAVEAQDVDEESIARLVTLARRTFRFVVIDTFPLLDNILLSILDVSDRLYVVLQGTVPDVIGTSRFLEVLDRLGASGTRRRVVLNRNYPPHAGRLAASDVEDRLEVPVDHELPYRRGLLVAQNAGRPYTLQPLSRFGYGPAHRKLVDEIESGGNGRESTAEGAP
ncbi:MAG: AAA family ATPase [Proteobacteria bacterium]|nr:AAA family ATPase [Pseudomonadota bacterium]